MHNASHEIKSVEDAARKAVTETIFSPRLYDGFCGDGCDQHRASTRGMGRDDGRV